MPMNRKQRRAAEKAGISEAAPPDPPNTVANTKLKGISADGKKIGLCMIVKNESQVILRCLESVRPIVDYVLLEDTGSTDGTQAIVREWLDRVGVAGEVYNEPWQDFAYNRSHALARLRENTSIDYVLLLDADDYAIFEQGFDLVAFKNSLSHELVLRRTSTFRFDSLSSTADLQQQIRI